MWSASWHIYSGNWKDRVWENSLGEVFTENLVLTCVSLISWAGPESKANFRKRGGPCLSIALLRDDFGFLGGVHFLFLCLDLSPTSHHHRCLSTLQVPHILSLPLFSFLVFCYETPFEPECWFPNCLSFYIFQSSCPNINYSLDSFSLPGAVNHMVRSCQGGGSRIQSREVWASAGLSPAFSVHLAEQPTCSLVLKLPAVEGPSVPLPATACGGGILC